MGPGKTLRGLILRSGAKSTTFRHNLISFSINTKCKPCPSVSMLPVAISATLSVGLRGGGMRGARVSEYRAAISSPAGRAREGRAPAGLPRPSLFIIMN